MTPARERLSALLVAMASIMFALGLAVLVYYFKVKQNEDYQNQLHFRELKTMIDSFDRGVGQAISAASLQRGRGETQVKNQKPFQALKSSIKKFQDESADNIKRLRQEYEKQQLLAEAIDDIQQSAAQQNQFSQTLTEKQTALRELEDSLALQEEELMERQDAYSNYWLDPITELITGNGNVFILRFLETCEIEGERSICAWFNTLTDDVMAPSIYGKSDNDSELEIQLLTGIERSLDNLLLFLQQAESVAENIDLKLSSLEEIEKSLESALIEIKQSESRFGKVGASTAKTQQKPAAQSPDASRPASAEEISKKYDAKRSRSHTSAKQQSINLKCGQSSRKLLQKECQSIESKANAWVADKTQHKSGDGPRELLLQKRAELSADYDYQSKVAQIIYQTAWRVEDYGYDQQVLDQIKEINARQKKVEATKRRLVELRKEEDSLIASGASGAAGPNQQDSSDDEEQARTAMIDSIAAIRELRSEMLNAPRKFIELCSERLEPDGPENLPKRLTPHIAKIADSCTIYADCIKQHLTKEQEIESKSCKSEADRLGEHIDEAFDARFGDGLFATLLRSSSALRNARLVTKEMDCAERLTARRGQLQFIKSMPSACASSAEWHAVASIDEASFLVVPLGDLLEAELERFPILLLVDGEGNTLLRRENVTIDAFQHGLEFEDITTLLSAASGMRPPGNLDSNSKAQDAEGTEDDRGDQLRVGYSGTATISLAGEEFRMFISPYRHQHVPAAAELGDGPEAAVGEYFMMGVPPAAELGNEPETAVGEFYLVGLKAESQLLSDKLAISNSMVLLGILLVLLLMVMVPLLKIRLVSPEQSYSTFDLRASHMGILLLSGLIAIALIDLWMYEHTKTGVEHRSVQIFKQIRYAFHDEYTELRKLGRRHTLDKENALEINREAAYPDYYLNEVSPMADPPEDPPFYFLENLFLLESTGDSAGKLVGTAFWSTYKFARTAGPPNVSQRQYYQRARDCELWQQGEEAECSGIFFERLFNLRDGVKKIQFSETFGNQTAAGTYDVRSYGAVLQTFLAPVLPPNYGFIVFENRSGTAIYHSDNSRSLVENFYVETDSDSSLRSIVQHARSKAPAQQRTSTYRGESHVFTIGELHEGIPWTLVVYYAKDELRALNLALAVAALAIMSVLAVIFAIVFLRGRNPRMPLTLRPPGPRLRGTSESLDQFTLGYLGTLGAFVFVLALCILVLVTLVGERYQDYVRSSIAESAMTADVIRRDYRDDFLDYQGLSISEPEPINAVACYLGHGTPVEGMLKPNQCATGSEPSLSRNHGSDQSLHQSVSFAGLINLLTRHSSLLEADDQYKELYSVETRYAPGDYTLKTLLRGLWTFILSILAFIALYLLCRHWIGKRLLGMHIPRQFRVLDAGEAPIDGATLSERLFSESDDDRFIQVIRPRTGLLATFVNKGFDSTYGNLVTQQPMHCMELLQHSQAEQTYLNPASRSPEEVLEALLKTRDSVPAGRADVLVLKGLESTSMTAAARMFTLEFLEFITERPNTRVVLLCEIAPLYRMIYQDEYPHRDDEEAIASSAEVVRWSDVLRRFRKVYDWTPREKPKLKDNDSTLKTLLHEAQGWPELEEIWREFWIYATGNPSLRHPDAKLPDPWCEDEELVLEGEFKTALDKWKPQQVIEFFSAHAGPFYRFRWEICTKAERLMLYQMAMDQQPNPSNLEPLEHLVRRGYIFYRHGWHIVNQSFARFIQTAEDQLVFSEWLSDADESSWKYLKLPLYAVVLALLAIVAYSATDAIESAVTVLSGLLGLIVMAVRSFAMFKGSSGSSG